MKRRKTLTKDRSITVRFSSEEAEALTSIATEYNTTISDVVRCATAGELDKYLGRVKYIDLEQGKAINHNIIILANVLSETRDHLRRIGVNFNQLVHKVNAGDLKELNNKGALITKQDLNTIMHRVELVTKEVAEVITCIAG